MAQNFTFSQEAGICKEPYSFIFGNCVPLKALKAGVNLLWNILCVVAIWMGFSFFYLIKYFFSSKYKVLKNSPKR